ncbi:Trimeric intracellular cation channel type B-A [Fasciola gigantica]|uniref:Trimeric intracellular cation channel type B-A n=1 Tax=Fasciola gigantica TaxID=46835 RepID=A0A504Y6B6_FASGI|nr:Trimeric intracellular cation channel type B-A [Fasciola gigantica]
MLTCASCGNLSNFICGSPLFVCFDDTRAVLTATVVWYLINYFPLDLLYRMSKFLPTRILICSLKEIQRARKISMGVHHGLHEFPESAVMSVLLGLLKALLLSLVNGQLGTQEKPVSSRVVHNENILVGRDRLLFASPGFRSTSGKPIVFDCGLYFRLSQASATGQFRQSIVTMILLGLKDPFSPFENITCTVMFGGTVDALRNALERSRARSTDASGTAATAATTPLPMGTAVLSGPSTAHVTTVGSSGSGQGVPSSTGIPSSPGANGQVGGRDTTGTRQTSDKKRD